MSTSRAKRVAALTALLALPSLLLPMVAAPARAAGSPDLVISQVYGGGGNSGATYRNDFVEVFNRGTATVSLAGWSIQYASAAGTTWQSTPLTGSVAPGRYYLVQEAAGAGGTTNLPTPDATGTIGMSASSGKVALVAPDGTRDLVGYGTANQFEGTGPAPGLTNTTAALRKADGRTDTDDNAADFATGAPNPRSSTAPGPAPLCDAAGATPVSAVQGSGTATPLSGQAVEVQAVVTAIRPGLGGYTVQEEPADQDADAATSEGLFVSGSVPAGTAEGDVVRVRGTAGEQSGRTRVAASGASRCGTGALPAPVDVELPVPDGGFLERLEGMLARFPQTLTISEYFQFGRFNETVVALPMPGRDRLDTPTAVVEPGAPAVELAAAYALRRILLDDGRNNQNPSPPYFPGTVDTPFTLDQRFRGGDTLTGVTGVVDFAFGSYRVHPTADATYASANPRPAAPPAVGGRITVASFNVLNYFLTADDGDPHCGAARDLECRGWDADQPDELNRQRAKIVDALVRLDADVVGLMEMENTPGVQPAADLVAGLNERLGAGTYDFIDTGVIGGDAIRVGVLYRPAVVRPAGAYAVLDSTVDPRFDDSRNRPALAQTFDEVGTGARFTVVVNHLKSKGSACAGDPDTGDGQGNCNQTRVAAAQALADWLAADPTRSGDPDAVIIGDLNSYDHEDPIDALSAAGYVDLVKQFGGEHAYSYVFDGQVGYLDHALASPSLAAQVTGSGDWHINADEPSLLDYDTSFKAPAEDALYQPNAYRASDHDPVLVGLDPVAAAPETCYAEGAQTVADYGPARRLNGTAIPTSLARPSEALGLSDPGEDPYYATLGLGGSLTLSFAHPVQNNNGDETDLRVVDALDGAKGGADSARVLASWDGQSWVEVGQLSGTGEVDLGSLSAARFVRVVDTTARSGTGATDGFDLDAVEVLSGCTA